MGVGIGGHSTRLVVGVEWRPGNRMIIHYDDGTHSSVIAGVQVAEEIALEAGLVIAYSDAGGGISWESGSA